MNSARITLPVGRVTSRASEFLFGHNDLISVGLIRSQPAQTMRVHHANRNDSPPSLQCRSFHNLQNSIAIVCEERPALRSKIPSFQLDLK